MQNKTYKKFLCEMLARYGEYAVKNENFDRLLSEGMEALLISLIRLEILKTKVEEINKKIK